MPDRISIPALREDYGPVWENDERVLALVEAVEAADAFVMSTDEMTYHEPKVRALADALARFDFGEET